MIERPDLEKIETRLSGIWLNTALIFVVLVLIFVYGCSECRPDQSPWTSWCANAEVGDFAILTGENMQQQVNDMQYHQVFIH